MRLLVVRRARELGIKGRSTIVIKHSGGITEKPVRDIDAVLVIGRRVLIRSGLPPVLSSFNIPLAIIALDSVSILFNPIGITYNNYRKQQYTMPKIRSLQIAADMISAKLTGMANNIRYYGNTPPPIEQEPEPSEGEPEDIYEERVRSWESTNSNRLWKHTINLIKPEKLRKLQEKYGFHGRQPKHRDPFNKTLSLMYAVLYSLATKALIAAGLDPTYGFLHRTRYSTPLTFDYTEMFKPVAIMATIKMINEHPDLPQLEPDGELTRDDVNLAVKHLYDYLMLKHKDTGKTVYQELKLRAFCLARHLEGRCRRSKVVFRWNRRLYRRR